VAHKGKYGLRFHLRIDRAAPRPRRRDRAAPVTGDAPLSRRPLQVVLTKEAPAVNDSHRRQCLTAISQRASSRCHRTTRVLAQVPMLREARFSSSSPLTHDICSLRQRS